MKKIIWINTLVFIVLILLLGAGCGKKNQILKPKPADLIKKSTLSEVLFGVYTIESALYYKSQKGINLSLYTTAYYNALFDKHKITKKQFTESLSYYIENDSEVSTIYQNVINKLMTMQTSPSAKTNKENQSNEGMPPLIR